MKLVTVGRREELFVKFCRGNEAQDREDDADDDSAIRFGKQPRQCGPIDGGQPSTGKTVGQATRPRPSSPPTGRAERTNFAATTGITVSAKNNDAPDRQDHADRDRSDKLALRCPASSQSARTPGQS